MQVALNLGTININDQKKRINPPQPQAHQSPQLQVVQVFQAKHKHKAN